MDKRPGGKLGDEDANRAPQRVGCVMALPPASGPAFSSLTGQGTAQATTSETASLE